MTRDRTLRERAIWQAASLLLDYPDESLADTLETVRALAAGLPVAERAGLDAVAEQLASATLPELQTEYVDSFDQQRRCSLYLTYFAYGDTRKRGAALLRFKQAYLACGLELDDAELPDHLGVVLEFAATADPGTGRQLLLDHRASIEALSLALREMDSPWAGAVDAVRATFPPLPGDQAEAVRRLIANGPPVEEVGLAPYGSPTGPIDVPMPAMRAPTR